MTALNFTIPVLKYRFCKINSARVIIKGKRVNRGAGYGLELPCEYHFEEDN